MNIFNLLASAASDVSASASNAPSNTGGGLFGGNTMILWILAIVVLVVFFFMSSRSRKKQMKEMEARFNSIAVGDKVITIGFIEGYIVEILPNNTYVLKTGSDEHPGYVTVAQRSIYKFFKPEELAAAEEPFAETQEDATQATETTETTETPVSNENQTKEEVQSTENTVDNKTEE